MRVRSDSGRSSLPPGHTSPDGCTSSGPRTDAAPVHHWARGTPLGGHDLALARLPSNLLLLGLLLLGLLQRLLQWRLLQRLPQWRLLQQLLQRLLLQLLLRLLLRVLLLLLQHSLRLRYRLRLRQSSGLSLCPCLRLGHRALPQHGKEPTQRGHRRYTSHIDCVPLLVIFRSLEERRHLLLGKNDSLHGTKLAH